MTQLHRIREIRHREQMSLRTFARRLETTTPDARDIDDPTHDITLSELYAAAEAMEIPAAELLAGTEHNEVQRLRGLLCRLMRSLETIRQRCQSLEIDNIAAAAQGMIESEMPGLEPHANPLEPDRARLGRLAESAIPVREFLPEFDDLLLPEQRIA